MHKYTCNLPPPPPPPINALATALYIITSIYSPYIAFLVYSTLNFAASGLLCFIAALMPSYTALMCVRAENQQ